MRFLILSFILIFSSQVSAGEIIMSCEGYHSYKSQRTDNDKMLFKYDDTILSEPTVMVRSKGDWIKWCDGKGEATVSDELTLGDQGAFCRSVREDDLIKAEVEFTLDFLALSYEVETQNVFNKELQEEVEVKSFFECKRFK